MIHGPCNVLEISGVSHHQPIVFDPSYAQLAGDGFHLHVDGLTGHGIIDNLRRYKSHGLGWYLYQPAVVQPV
jgi:hypothetical protein